MLPWIALGISLLTPLASLLLLRTNKRSIEAGTSEVQSRAAGQLTESYETLLTRTDVNRERLEGEIVGLRTRIATLEQAQAAERAAMEARMDALERHNRQLTMWSQLLFSQVVESGGDPIPFEKVSDSFN